ncbi:hypothetical protein H6P81_003745 [Aristolochia fimbriata]|uniref:Uncharacterized protein n=1 Tax=Aristolochia fimbriata TaxID=158543 RepID=A0AAV7FGL2_ARIFI|nr:hypothetical protein H6P81_003745 [Aristolochia fimbriata]
MDDLGFRTSKRQLGKRKLGKKEKERKQKKKTWNKQYTTSRSRFDGVSETTGQTNFGRREPFSVECECVVKSFRKKQQPAEEAMEGCGTSGLGSEEGGREGKWEIME